MSISGLCSTWAFVRAAGSTRVIQAGELMAIGETSTFLPVSQLPVFTTK